MTFFFKFTVARTNEAEISDILNKTILYCSDNFDGCLNGCSSEKSSNLKKKFHVAKLASKDK